MVDWRLVVAFENIKPSTTKHTLGFQLELKQAMLVFEIRVPIRRLSRCICCLEVTNHASHDKLAILFVLHRIQQGIGRAKTHPIAWKGDTGCSKNDCAARSVWSFSCCRRFVFCATKVSTALTVQNMRYSCLANLAKKRSMSP